MYISFLFKIANTSLSKWRSKMLATLAADLHLYVRTHTAVGSGSLHLQPWRLGLRMETEGLLELPSEPS